MLDKPEDDLPINAVMILEFPPDPQKYQQESGETPGLKGHFSVSTRELLARVLAALLPGKDYAFFQREVEGKADLYGPLWLGLTLALLLAVVSNLLQFVAGRPWHYDFGRLGSALLLVCSYSWAVPLLLWAFLTWHGGAQIRVRLPELLSLYGYSLTVYLPAVLLCFIRVAFFQCTILLLANIISSAVLISFIMPSTSLKKESIIATMISLNFIFTMAVYFMFIRV